MVFGFNGVAGTAVVISLTAFLPLLILRQFVSFSFFRFIVKPFTGSLLMAGVVSIVLWSVTGFMRIPLAISVGVATYAAFIWLVARHEITPFISKYFHANR